MADTPLHEAITRLMSKSNYNYVQAGIKLEEAKYDRHRRYAELLGRRDHRYNRYEASGPLVKTVAADVIDALVDKKYFELTYRDAMNRILVEHPVLRAMYTDGIATVDSIEALKEIVEPLKREDIYY